MSGSRMGGGIRRAIGSLVTLALLAAALGFYLASPRHLLTAGPPAATGAQPAPTRALSQDVSPSPTPTATTTGSDTQDRGTSPDRKLPPGPGGREAGIELLATPTSEGQFDVVERVRLAEPITQLMLAAPDVRPASPLLRATHPVIEALQVTADGRHVKLSTRTFRRSIGLQITRPADLFELRYRLRGVTVINTPSSTGRALGGFAPLVTGVPEDLPVAINVRGHFVRNLSCPLLPMDDQACAAGHPPKWRVNRKLPRRAALVAVQFDISATQVGAPQ